MHAARLSPKVCMHLWRRAVLCEVWLCSALERVGGNATQNCNGNCTQNQIVPECSITAKPNNSRYSRSSRAISEHYISRADSIGILHPSGGSSCLPPNRRYDKALVDYTPPPSGGGPDTGVRNEVFSSDTRSKFKYVDVYMPLCSVA